MHINDSEFHARFRAEVREWIATAIPDHMKGHSQGILGRQDNDRKKWAPLEQAFSQKGWDAPQYPPEFGGAGFDTIQMVILMEEMANAGIPYRNEAAMHNITPILMKYGTPEQQKRFIRPTLMREIRWGQGYSEPGAGSDLASLALATEVVEGGFRVTGQKIWSTMAHHADWFFVLGRTDPHVKPRQAGISFLLIDARSPGVEVRPLVTIDDYHHFNEIFFDNVFVPAENLVGELNKGWTVAKALLGYERFYHTHANPALIQSTVDDIKVLARERSDAAGGVLWDDVALRRHVAALEMDNDCMRFTRYRALTRVEQGVAPGPETTFFKLLGTHLMQHLVECECAVTGSAGLTWEPEPFGPKMEEIARHSANVRSATIRGGTSEVQKNVIAKRVLGLPD